MQEGIVRELQDRQTQLSRRLAELQQQLFRLEDQYLEATQLRGNVVRGWDSYLDFKPRSLPANASSVLGGQKKDRRLKGGDRLFSFSAMNAPIPKPELEREEDVSVAQKWADEYAKAVNRSVAEVMADKSAGDAVSTTTNNAAAAGSGSGSSGNINPPSAAASGGNKRQRKE